MPRKEKKFYELNITEYDIAGNSLRVWRDEDGKIVFLLDETIDEFKPNVLLVMNAVGERKWDDVLQNDYGVDLETVRPKRDNLYQKLDIEYYGLDEYNRLITAYENGDDIDDALSGVINFRDAAARRAATVRLTTALDVVAQAEETLARTEHSVQSMRERRKKLRVQLNRQKSLIGQEPTKQSASRILHIESQIESNDEKIARAEKRIESAKRRIASAMDEAEEAREFLGRRRDGDFVPDVKQYNNDTTKKLDVDEEDTFDTQDDEFDEQEDNELTDEPKEQDMDNSEEVKPLLDQDPEILDEEIAFKPVKFDDIETGNEYPREHNAESVDNTENQEQVADGFENDIGEERYKTEEDTVVRPLAFSSAQSANEYTDSYESPDSESDGVLNTIKTVEEPVPADTDTTGDVINTQYENNTVVRPAAYNNARPAPVSNRPISPISGHGVRPVDVKVNNRPTVAYYLLLILLIALSVFALWLYQQKNTNGLPVLNTAPVEGTEAPVENNDVGDDMNMQQVLEQPEVPVVVSEDRPINIIYPNDDVLRAAEPAPVVIESEDDVLARKEPYNVSQHEKMFVAPEPVPEPVVRETNVVLPDVIVDEDVITVPMPAPNYVEEEEDVPVVIPDQSQEYYGEWYAQEDVSGANMNDAQEYQEYYYDNGGYQQEPAQYNYYEAPQGYTPQEYAPQGYDNQYIQDDGIVYEEDVPVPTPQKHLSIHDGGQYSISYEETAY